MSRTKRIFLFTLPAVLLLLMGQGTGPTVFTPRLTVQPGPLTVTTGDTTVEDLIINGTCTGCPSTNVPSADGEILRSDGAGGIKVNGDAAITTDDLTVGGQIISTTGGFVAPNTGVAGAAFGFASDPDLGMSRQAADTLQLQANGGVFLRADWPDGITIGGTGITTIPTTLTGRTIATGGITGTGGVNVGDRFSAGTQSPTSLSANTNNWALTPVPVVLITSSAAVNVTGIDASTANADSLSNGNNVLLNLINTSANQITFTNEDSNSTAANRFTLPYGASYVIGTGESVQVYYNSGASRWYVANAKQISAQTNGTFGLGFNTGCTTTFSTGSHRYAKRGNDVWLTLIGGGNCTSNATTFTAAASSLPAAITPDGTICTRIRGTDNGAAMEILLCLLSTGGATLSTCNANGACNAAGWTNSGTKGFTGQNVTFAYNVDSNGTPSGGGN